MTTIKKNPPEAWGAGRREGQGGSKSTLPLFNLFVKIAQPHLTPREQRCLDALRKAAGEGILSYRLREISCCAYVPDVIQRLRAKGYVISCVEEPHTTIDSVSSSIGRYKLLSEAMPV